MRAIKFRAWDKVSEDWHYVEITKSIFETQMALPSQPMMHGGQVDGLEWQQYTGLKDKNGVEIYEGDVVNMHYFYEAGGMNGTYESEAEIRGAVAYRPDFAVFVVADKERDYPITEYCQEPTEELEVIGNIYENPELLEVGE